MLYRPGLLGRVPCPMDWYFGSGAPVINEDFTTAVGLGSWTFTRASANATDCMYLDGSSITTYRTYNTNEARMLQFGLLMEPARTNYMLNSESPTAGAKTITLAVGTYTMWYLGAAATLAVAAGTAVITGAGTATVGTPRTFAVTTAGTVTVTVLANTLRAQIENGPDATSYILSGATAQTRAEDHLLKNYFGGQINSAQGTYWVEFMWNGPQFPDTTTGAVPAKLMAAGTGSFANNASADIIQVSSSSGVNTAQGATYNSAGTVVLSGATITPPRALGNVSRIAVSVSDIRNQIAMDYGTGTEAVSASANRPSFILSVTLGSGGLGPSTFNGYMRGFRYWPVAMNDIELHECTAPGYYNNSPVFDMDGTQVAQWRLWSNIRPSASGVITDAKFEDPAGTPFNTYTLNQLRCTPRGLLTDPNTTNSIPNSGAIGASGTISGLLANQGYMLSMRGAGAVTLVAGGTATLPITLPVSATQGNNIWFIATTSGTVNWTATAPVEIAQFAGVAAQLQYLGLTNGPSSYIQTAGVAQFRQVEYVVLPTNQWHNLDEYTLYIELIMFSGGNGGSLFFIDDAALTSTSLGPNRDILANTVTGGTNGVIGFNRFAAGVAQGAQTMPPPGTGIFTPLVLHKIALTVSATKTQRRISLDGAMSGYNTLGAHPGPHTRIVLGANPSAFRRVRYYDYSFSDDALVALTTP